MILRCCIVGESELAIDCARILSEFDFSIAVVITNDVKFAQWSKQNNIQVFSNQSDIWENIRDVEYDILFSIVNPTILSEKMLASPKIMAINYHNSLLPTYAGVNSTAWAIYNNESMHGVTWHKIAKGIDTGDLIIQGELAIDANHETVQSLDARCCTMGLKIFSNLLELIKHNRYILTKQDVSKRVYYSYLDKPKSNGVISFDDKATNILRKLRALLIPNVRENRFATPKIFIEDECYIIKKAKILPINSTIPAVINAVASNSVRVSTCDFDIELLELCYLSGEPITHAILTTDLIGKKLNHPESCIEKTLANKASEYAKKESYWVNQFLSSHSNDTFLMKTCFSENSNKHIDAITMQINFEKRYNDLSSLANTFNTDTPKIILIVWLIYIYRLNSCEDYTVGLSRNDNYKSLYENKMFSSVVPLNINILADMSVESVITMLLNQLENNMLHNETFENDIFYRYPQLAGKYPNHTFSFSLYQQSDKVNKCPVQISIDEHKIIISISQSHYSGFFTKILDRVQAHFETLLCSIINNISASVCHINYMTTHEVQTLLSFNTTKQNLPTTNMVEQFTAISNKYPKKIAVISDNNQLTYDELDGISNKIAHYINNHYSKKENYVFVCFDNRMLMVIALLSILKVNKTYIPLGYQNPDSFIKNIVLDVGGDLFFVEEAYKEKFIKFIKNDTPPITLSMNEVIDYKENKKAKQDKVISPLKTTTSQQAYVMYTSGTTGVPKGVCIPQAAILRLVVNTNYVDFEKCHTVAFASDVTFDAATFEVWGALLNGSTLVCVPKNVLIDPRKLENILVEKAIDLLFLTPALFEQYALHYPTIFSLLKYLVLGGDVINLGVMNKYIKQNIKRPRHILNCYGPTENTTFTTYFEIDQTTDCLDSIPIGKPITNTNIFVLDKYYNLMPFNVPGELYASGMGLMTKYLNKYEMTKSVLDWHAIYPQKTTVKTYKTGDVVYWNNNHQLVFISRIDEQAKINGFRIELTATESAIQKYPGIDICKVLPYKSKNVQELIAYVVSKNNQINPDAVKLFLKNMLPAQYIPSHILLLKEFPLNKNGKIDVSQLPKPLYSSSTAKQKKLPKVNQTIVKIWKNILQTNIPISKTDNFFELGGTSLQLISLLCHVEKHYKKHISIHDFLECPTIKHIENLLGNKSLIKSSIVSSQIKPQHIYTDLMLTKYLDKAKISLTKNNKKLKNVLLTGSTGFVGFYLLKKLLSFSTLTVYCLIRADSTEHAKKKLTATANKYQISLNGNIKIINGDFSLKNFGMNSYEYNMLCSTIDAVYHVGAAVNHLYNYEQLRGHNVLGTLEIINFSVNKKLKKINYISTLSSGVDELNESGFIKEDFVSQRTPPTSLQGGYALTKWVSEYILAYLKKKNVPLSIYRLGWIWGDMNSGIMPVKNNHLIMLIKLCIQLRLAPNWQARVNILPVDFISDLIVEDAMISHGATKVVNMLNPQPVTWCELITWISNKGCKIKFVTPSVWKKQLLQHESLETFPFLSLYRKNNNQDWLLGQDHFSDCVCNNLLDIMKTLERSFPNCNVFFNKTLSHIMLEAEDILV